MKRTIITACVLAALALTGCEIDEPASEVTPKPRTDSTPEAAAASTSTVPTSDPAPEPDPEPEATEPAETISQANAVRAARNYLDLAPFSRSGLIDQLTFEGYDTADATYAVDAVAPDWNRQAALAAENYLDMMPFSRQGLIDQLVFEGYTREQATHGVDQAGL
ncbi:Ltp family lipoprotein [Nocardioides sp. AE5]|uniref:Ltp family lipoprotein n=1 Tax=Nocardioides sp. AE5 TaxID=2962573 RepID=UPI00288162E7|nr:Ltp family lipoprotein [Nocardioides sp. AE5]MDT0200371.1 Ltp family lipoprotein [Nocardioides sp. AE5]